MSSTRTLVTLLRPWIRRFTIIICAWWLRTSSKFTWEEVKTSTGKLGKWSTPKRVRIRPKYSAPSLSRDRRIKMHQSINQSINLLADSQFVFCFSPPFIFPSKAALECNYRPLRPRLDYVSVNFRRSLARIRLLISCPKRELPSLVPSVVVLFLPRRNLNQIYSMYRCWRCNISHSHPS